MFGILSKNYSYFTGKNLEDLHLNILINYLVVKNVRQPLFVALTLCTTKFTILNSAHVITFFNHGT